MIPAYAFGCLPTTIWARDVAYSGELVKGATFSKTCPTKLNQNAQDVPWLQVTKFTLNDVIRRPPFLKHLTSPEGHEKLEGIAPRMVDLMPGELWGPEFEVDIPYLNDLEKWRQKLRNGTIDAQELLATGQMASFIPYLLLIGDWKALTAYFTGLLKVNLGLALLLRDRVRELQLCQLGQWLKQAERIPPPEVLARPRPPTAPLAPPSI